MRTKFIFIFILSVMPWLTHADLSLWQQLRDQPNMIVLLRHSYVEGGNPLHWDTTGQCREERRLSEKGRSFAAIIGDRFKQEGITPTVISSPMCRTLQTARIAFGKAISDPELRVLSDSGGAQSERFLAKAKQLLREHRGNQPIAFINHRPNIELLTLEMIPIGDLIVGQIDDQGEIDVLGIISISP